MWWIVGAVVVAGLVLAGGFIRHDLRRHRGQVDIVLADARRRDRENYDWRPWADRSDSRWQGRPDGWPRQ